jgi:hypothetical protein
VTSWAYIFFQGAHVKENKARCHRIIHHSNVVRARAWDDDEDEDEDEDDVLKGK